MTAASAALGSHEAPGRLPEGDDGGGLASSGGVISGCGEGHFNGGRKGLFFGELGRSSKAGGYPEKPARRGVQAQKDAK